MRFIICGDSTEDGTILAKTLTLWLKLACVNAEVSIWNGKNPFPDGAEKALFFWDVDSLPLSKAKPGLPLIVCSSNAQNAIRCYPNHPAGFLHRPFRLGELDRVMFQCIPLWWDSVERLDVQNCRTHLQMPILDLHWVESEQGGCRLHGSKADLLDQRTLSELEQDLLDRTFIRCQRSFLVNLRYVRQIRGKFFQMLDGTQIPIGRDRHTHVSAAYTFFLTQRGDNPENPIYGAYTQGGNDCARPCPCSL